MIDEINDEKVTSENIEEENNEEIVEETSEKIEEQITESEEVSEEASETESDETSEEEEETGEDEEGFELKIIPTSELNIDSKLVQKINYKPVAAPWVIMAFGIVLFFTKNVFGILCGVFFVAMGLFVMFVIKEHQCIDIYEDCLVVYADVSGEQVAVVPFTEITQWYVNDMNTGNQGITILVGEYNDAITSDSFQLSKFYNTMIKLLPEKEQHTIRMEASKQQRAAFKFSDVFKNIKNIFKKK